MIVHAVNQGKGRALQTGLRTLTERGADFVLILDADGQHLPEEIPRFLEAAKRSPERRMFVGNRMEDVRAMPKKRLYTNRFMSGQISLLCGQDIPDTQCGFRMIHRDLVPRLLTSGQAGRFDYETEMLILTAWAGEKIGAVPVSTVYGEETSSIHPVRDTVRFLKLMGRYWRQRLSGG